MLMRGGGWIGICCFRGYVRGLGVGVRGGSALKGREDFETCWGLEG